MTTNKMLDIDLIRKMGAKPKVFEPGEPLFWNDPHISGEMLKAHLDPNTDAASRRPEMIARLSHGLIRHLDSKPEISCLFWDVVLACTARGSMITVSWLPAWTTRGAQSTTLERQRPTAGEISSTYTRTTLHSTSSRGLTLSC